MIEDENLDTVDTKLDKFFVAGSVITILIITALIIFIIVKIFSMGDSNNPDDQNQPTVTVTPELTPTPQVTPTPTDETYAVPKVVGLTEEDAKASILANDADALVVTKPDYSDLFEEGIVIEQYPQANSEVESGSQVTITISLGPQAFELPNVYNLSEARADKKLKEEDLIPSHEYISSDDIEDGYVISTDPERQELVVKGDTITVYVSTGPENKQVSVPNIIGRTQEDAAEQLQALGLDIGNVSYESSEEYDEGFITYQSNTTGQKVDEGTLIDIIVSTGPEDTTTSTDQNVRYIGQVTIDENPFDYIDSEEANIVLELALEIDGDTYKTNIIDSTFKSEDFPLTITGIEGENSSEGIVKMYVDGVLFKLPGETEAKTWTVEFEAVEE